jgi:hypothetical protein
MKKRNILVLLFCLLLIALGIYWWTKHITPLFNEVHPGEWTPQTKLLAKKSLLVSALNISVKDINSIINKSVPEILLDDQSFEKDNLKLMIKRTGSLKINMKGDSIFCEVPLVVNATYRIDTNKFFVKIKVEKGTSANIILGLASKISLNNNWTLSTRTIQNKLIWTKEPTINFGIINVSLRSIADIEIKKLESNICNIIDKSTSSYVSLYNIAEKQWNSLQKQIELTRKPQSIWLKIYPQKVFLGRINGNNKELKIETGIESILYTSFNDLDTFKLIRLPKLIKDNTIKNGFDLNLVAEIPFDNISKVLNDSLRNKEINYNSGRVKITNVRIFPSLKGIAVEVKVKGDVNGKVYLTGNLEIDSSLKFIKISSFNYAVNSSDVTAQIADMIFHSNLQTEISSKLNLNISNQIEKLPNIIQVALSKGNVGKAADIIVDRIDFKLTNISIQKESIQLMINSKGSIDTRLYINSK